MLIWNAAAVVVSLGVGTTAMGGVSFDPGVTISGAGIALNVEAVDIDADLDLDLVVAREGSVDVYRNNGNGTFAAPQQITGLSGARALAIGDIDCDGDLDFVVNRNDFASDTVRVYRNNGVGVFTLGSTHTAFDQVRYARLGDMDSDGDLDLVVLSIAGSELGVFFNSGSGVFGARIDYNHTQGAAGLALGDIDQDGDLDVVAGWPSAMGVNTEYSVSKNNGNGTLAAPVLYATAGSTVGLSLGDLDGDNDLDLVISDSGPGGLKTALNNGSGTFGTATTNSSQPILSDPRLIDMDGDGDLDVVGASTNGDDIVVTFNNGVGGFSGTVDLPAGDSPEEVAVGDLDRDGDLDIVAACQFSQTLEIRFQSGNPGGPDDSVNVSPIVISGLTHTFEDSRGGSNDRITDTVSFSASGSGLYSNQSFITSIREGNEIVVRAEAAPGYRFLIEPPANPAWGATTTFGLSAYWLEAGLANLGLPVPLSAQGTHTFENLTGTAPTMVERRDRVTCDGRRVQVSRLFDVSQPCSFTALELRFPVTNAPPDQLKVYTPVEGGQFGAETEGEGMSDVAVMQVVFANIGECVSCVDTEGENATTPCLSGLNHGCFSSPVLGDSAGVVPDEGHGFGAIVPGVVMCGKLSCEAYVTGIECDVDTFLFEVPPMGGLVTIDWLSEVDVDVSLGRLGPSPAAPCAGRATLVATPIGGTPACGTSVLRTPPDSLPVDSRLLSVVEPGVYFVAISKHGGSGAGNIALCSENLQYKLRVTVEPPPETIEIPTVVISELVHLYWRDDPNFHVYDGVVFPSGPGVFSGPGFTASIGSNDEVVARFSAPAGSKFSVKVPLNAHSRSVSANARWFTENLGPGGWIYSPCTVTWIGLSGPAPTPLQDRCGVLIGGEVVSTECGFTYTQPFEFEALEIRFTVGPGVSKAVRTYGSVNSSSEPSFKAGASGPFMADAVVMELVTTPPPCPADANGDNVVNGADLSVLLSQFGQSITPGTGGDANGDGLVNGADLSVLLSNFGTTC